jgi:L-aspartate oxidase
MKPPESYDVLVLGSGIAGLLFALKMSEKYSVCIVTKSTLAESNTFYAQGGIAAVFDDKDTFEAHIKDTLRLGEGLSRPDYVRAIIENAPRVIATLEGYGVQFTKHAKEYDLGIEAGHSHRRIVHSGDLTGETVEQILVEQVKKTKTITVLENMLCYDLVTANGICAGAYAVRKDNDERICIKSRITMLATGGIGSLFEYTSNSPVATGDGLAIAYRAGARLSDLEFIQFHPTALNLDVTPKFLLSEALRGEGAELVDEQGDKFMYRYHPDAEMAPRDIVTRAIIEESKQHTIFLSLTHLNPYFVKKRFPGICRKLLEYGMDCTNQPVPIVPVAHYHCGGVCIDPNGQTSVFGLYASGEVANGGLHGANRLASNSLLEGAAQSLHTAEILYEEGLPDLYEIAPVFPQDVSSDSATDYTSLRTRMWNALGIIRSVDGMSEMLQYLSGFNPNDFVQNYDQLQFRNMLQSARLITYAALQREESRGTHYRVDYPDRNVEWMRHIEIKKNVSLKTVFFLGRFQPVPHNGHLHILEGLLKEYDVIIIGLGSAQESRTEENYATVSERTAVWQKILDRINKDQKQVYLIPIPDINDNDRFVEHVQKLVPPFNEIFSGNKLVIRLFKDAGSTVHEIKERYKNISNAALREALKSDKPDLQELLPVESLDFLKKHGFIK